MGGEKVPVRITIYTPLVGTGYYDGLTAERFAEEQIDSGPAPITTFVRRDGFVVSQSGDSVQLLFNDVPGGRHRIRLKDSDSGKTFWRSPLLPISNGNGDFRFTLIQPPVEQLTFAGADFEAQIELPIVQDIPDLDEDVKIDSLDIDIRDAHIDVDGSGVIAKGEEWTILQSDLSFDYDFSLEPSKSLDANRLLRVLSVGPLTLNLSNPVTGVGAACMENEIKERIRENLEAELNRRINARLRDEIGDRFGQSELIEQVTATVLSVKHLRTGETVVELPNGNSVSVPTYSLQMMVDISVPTALISTGNSGCSMTAAGVFASLGLTAAAACYLF